MSYKCHRGRWPEVEPLEGAFEVAAAAEGIGLLALSARHAIRAGVYGTEYRDPFDRVMAPQAIEEGLALISKDRWMEGMGRW